MNAKMKANVKMRILVSAAILVLGCFVGAYAQAFKLPPRVDLQQHLKTGEGREWGGYHAPSVRMWGWSRNGLVAYSMETINYDGSLNAALVILNIVNDKVAHQLNLTLSEENKGNATVETFFEADFDALYVKNRNRITQALQAHNIVERQVDFSQFPLRHDNMIYNARAVVTHQTPIDECCPGPDARTSYQVVVDRDNTQSKTIKTVENASAVVSVHIGGYFKSPFENRALVVIVERVWVISSGIESWFKFSGCHLGTGFR